MLVKCKECEAEISSKAKQCPHCGGSTQSRGTSIIKAISGLALAVVSVGIGVGTPGLGFFVSIGVAIFFVSYSIRNLAT